MRNAIHTWGRSLGAVARSPLPVLALAVVAALWCWAAYAWLGLPESSLLLLALALLWAVVQILAVVALATASVISAVGAVATDARQLTLGSFVRVQRRQLRQTLLLAVAATMAALLVGALFGWINAHALEVASFLTFRSGKPVSHVVIEKVYAVIEGLLGIALAGFFLSLLIQGLRDGWTQARKQVLRTLAASCFRTPFLSAFLSVLIFGGLPYLLATWHPKVSPGFPDYAQMVARLGLALVLLVVGWLFWILSLSRLNRPPETPPPSA